ncbi:hypothetical protein [Aquamicrobium sp.]|uniref:hypothetical protein n=1 Tax=Aquamicrobium sp. TaxID=1872579 RepID=UPI00258EB620|nr:hypothetical protein [Aquamicrobium sp.]MCK9552328.1 hypothetical protein [Aquamicrobium sp.]
MEVKFENLVDYPKFEIGNEYDVDVIARAAGYLNGDEVATISYEVKGYQIKMRFNSIGDQKIFFDKSSDISFAIASKYAKSQNKEELIEFIENYEETFNRCEIKEEWQIEFYKDFIKANLVDMSNNSWFEPRIVVTKDELELFDDYESSLYSSDVYTFISEIENLSKKHDVLIEIFNAVKEHIVFCNRPRKIG